MTEDLKSRIIKFYDEIDHLKDKLDQLLDFEGKEIENELTESFKATENYEYFDSAMEELYRAYEHLEDGCSNLNGIWEDPDSSEKEDSN